MVMFKLKTDKDQNCVKNRVYNIINNKKAKTNNLLKAENI